MKAPPPHRICPRGKGNHLATKIRRNPMKANVGICQRFSASHNPGIVQQLHHNRPCGDRNSPMAILSTRCNNLGLSTSSVATKIAASKMKSSTPSPAPSGEESPPVGLVEINPTPSPVNQRRREPPPPQKKKKNS
jgi:hypothetical protein